MTTRASKSNGGSPVKAPRRLSRGGAQRCLQCGQLATFVIKCDLCYQPLHKECVLSLDAGTQLVCVKCFEGKKLSASALDDHMYAPFSPNNTVPWHTFTRNYAVRKDLLNSQDSQDSQDSVRDKQATCNV